MGRAVFIKNNMKNQKLRLLSRSKETVNVAYEREAPGVCSSLAPPGACSQATVNATVQFHDTHKFSTSEV